MTDETNGAKRERRRLTLKDKRDALAARKARLMGEIEKLDAEDARLVADATAQANALLAQVGGEKS